MKLGNGNCFGNEKMRKACYWLLNSLLNVSKRKRFNSKYENGRLRNGTNNKKHEVYMLRIT